MAPSQSCGQRWMLCSASRPPVEAASEVRLQRRCGIACFDDVDRRISGLLQGVPTPVRQSLVVQTEGAVERAARAALVTRIAAENRVAPRHRQSLVRRAGWNVADDIGNAAVEAAAPVHQRLLIPVGGQCDPKEDVGRRGVERGNAPVHAAVFSDESRAGAGGGDDGGVEHGAAHGRQRDGAGRDRHAGESLARRRRLRDRSGRGARHQYERGQTTAGQAACPQGMQ
jgi:hypothetical protein